MPNGLTYNPHDIIQYLITYFVEQTLPEPMGRDQPMTMFLISPISVRLSSKTAIRKTGTATGRIPIGPFVFNIGLATDCVVMNRADK
jgi:hypothetical protein